MKENKNDRLKIKQGSHPKVKCICTMKYFVQWDNNPTEWLAQTQYSRLVNVCTIFGSATLKRESVENSVCKAQTETRGWSYFVNWHLISVRIFCAMYDHTFVYVCKPSNQWLGLSLAIADHDFLMGSALVCLS